MPQVPQGLHGEECKVTLSSKIFEEKTALNKNYQYTGDADKTGPSWRSDVFDYFVSKWPAAGPWGQGGERAGAVQPEPKRYCSFPGVCDPGT